MKTIHIIKAQPTPGERIEGIEIHINAHHDTRTLRLGEVTERHEREAQKLFEALYETLPGGVFDTLAGLMLKAIASHVVISRKARHPTQK